MIAVDAFGGRSTGLALRRTGRTDGGFIVEVSLLSYASLSDPIYLSIVL